MLRDGECMPMAPQIILKPPEPAIHFVEQALQASASLASLLALNPVSLLLRAEPGAEVAQLGLGEVLPLFKRITKAAQFALHPAYVSIKLRLDAGSPLMRLPARLLLLQSTCPLTRRCCAGVLLRLHGSIEPMQLALDPVHMHVQLLLNADRTLSKRRTLCVLFVLGPCMELAEFALDPVNVCVEPLLEVAHTLMKARDPGVKPCLDGIAEAAQLLLSADHACVVLLHERA
mmetsp:Transcript_21282/g.60239  ORF Transcript_21282/g.60239 Transcript_21282/m.60239 type:complete len:231 (+) Transcript_21282:443-1135(+)